MKYAIFILAVFLIAPGCSRKEKSSHTQKTRVEKSISEAIAKIDKINDTLSVFTRKIASAASEGLNEQEFQGNLQAKLDGYSRHLSSCKSEIKSLALVNKKCRTKISKLQEVISMGEEKIRLLQKELARIKMKPEKRESQLARAD